MNRTMVTHWEGMLAFETWANERVLASLLSIPPAHHGHADHARAWGLLAHNTLARQVWLWRTLGTTYNNPADWFPIWDESRMRATLADVDAQWGAFVRGQSDADLTRLVRYSTSESLAYESSVGEILAHVCNHSTYHRGQIARIVHLLGGQRATTDLIAMTRRPMNAPALPKA